MSNVVLIKPYKLFFKGNWFVYDCQNRESATGKNEIEADRILAENMSRYLIRLTIENEKRISHERTSSIQDRTIKHGND